MPKGWDAEAFRRNSSHASAGTAESSNSAASFSRDSMAATAAAVGAGGGRPPVYVVGGQLAARRRVERLELGAAREVEGAPAQAGLATAAAAHAEVGQVFFEGELQK